MTAHGREVRFHDLAHSFQPVTLEKLGDQAANRTDLILAEAHIKPAENGGFEICADK